MLQIEKVSKSFGEIKAVNQVSLAISERSVFGILGTNGAGKSTLLRMLAGILKADEGDILIDGTSVKDMGEGRQELFYLSDAPYYFPNATLQTMKEFYMSVYPKFDADGFEMMRKKFELEEHRRIRTFSKGMKRQAFILLAICANTKYILCDEVFDGLDPVVSKVVKDIFRTEMELRNLTLVMASHDLRELEDFCDTIGIMHKGGILMSGEIKEDAKDMYKVQCVFDEGEEPYLREHLRVIKYEKTGMFVTLVVKGTKEEITECLKEKNPTRYEMLPLSIEEIFLCRMEGTDYDIKDIIL